MEGRGTTFVTSLPWFVGRVGGRRTEGTPHCPRLSLGSRRTAWGLECRGAPLLTHVFASGLGFAVSEGRGLRVCGEGRLIDSALHGNLRLKSLSNDVFAACLAHALTLATLREHRRQRRRSNPSHFGPLLATAPVHHSVKLSCWRAAWLPQAILNAILGETMCDCGGGTRPRPRGLAVGATA